MNRLLLSLLLISASFTAFANSMPAPDNQEIIANAQEISPEAFNMGLEQFLEMTPAKYKEITGKRLGIKNTLKLKAAQKIVKSKLKKDAADISSGVYVLLAILGLGWLAMGLLSDWEGSDWIVALVLSLLCWLPGVIYSLIKKKDYY